MFLLGKVLNDLNMGRHYDPELKRQFMEMEWKQTDSMVNEKFLAK